LRLCIPDVLHAEAASFESRIDPKLDNDALGLKLIFTSQLPGALRKHMVKASLQTFAFFPLPLAVVLGIQKDNVLARDVGWSSGGSEALPLHRLFHVSCDR